MMKCQMSMPKPAHISHTHCQAAQASRTNQSLSKSVSEPTHGQKIKKHESTTKYKKHRADNGFREFSALNKHLTRLTGKCSESPTFFIQRRWRSL